MSNRTIAAIATPNAPGGIGTIRISGEKALEIAAKVFRPAGGKNLCGFVGYTASFGSVYANNEKPTNGEFIALVADKMLSVPQGFSYNPRHSFHRWEYPQS